MTSLAPNTIPSAPSSTPQASSNTPSAHSGSQSTSGQSSTIAAATAGSRPTQPLYAQAAKKAPYTPPIVSSTVGSSPSVVGGAPGSNARTSNASPVNGKNQVAPAVPTVTPAMNSVIVNGTSGPSNGHGRKPSAVSGGNGGNAWMQNGNPQANRLQQNNQPSIRFGSFPPDQSMQQVPGSAPVSSPNLSAPAVPNPRISSPQMSPSPLPQPAVSGGPLTQGMQNQNIQFGAWGGNVADRGDQRQIHRQAPMPIPPVPTAQGPGGHMRRESSSHQQHPEMPQPGMGSNRGGMPGNNRRNPGPPFGGQNTYQHQAQGYNNHNHNNYNNNRNAPNQSRNSSYQAPINQPHYPSVPGANYQSPRQPPRSPAMHHPLPHTQPVPHSLPGTPQLGTVQIANSPSFPSANLYPTVHQQQLFPPAQQPYDPNMYSHPSYAHMHGYGQYPGGPPPASPRGQYATLNAPPYMNMNMGYVAPPTMTRSASSAAADINRPPSGFGVPHTPMISPPPPNPAYFKKPDKVSKGVKITRPDGTPLNLNAEPLETPKPKPVVVSSSSPVIVSSGNPPPRPAVPEGKKSAAEVGRDMALQVQKRIEENEARELELKKAEEERSKREAKEAEEKKRKEEEERKRKEEEEERLRKEAEEKARLEEEERKRQEAEAARIAKEKAEEEARIAKEKEEEEKRRREEEEKRIREEEERRLREEEERRVKEAEEKRLKEEEERRLKEEEERRVKEAEEKRLKEEQEAKQKLKEQAERLAKEEEERKAKEEAKAAAEAAAAAAKSAEALTEDTAQQTKPEPASQVSSPQPPPATDEATRPTKPRGSKPSPLVLKTSTEPGPPSAALTALRSARFIGDINSVKYPDNILSPNPALNAAAPAGKFKYQKDFLLQFQNVFTEKPSVDWDQIIRDSVGEPTDSARPSASSKMGALGGGRSGSRSGAPAAQPPMGMGSMGPMGGFGTGKFGLPPMTSTQRFEQSNRALASNPLAAVGQFRAGPPSISRTNSSQGLPQQGGALPQSPRIRSSRGERGGERGPSKRGNTAAGGIAMEKSESKQAEPKPVLTIPVSDVKPLASTGTGWKPRTVQAAASTGAAPGSLSAVAPPVPTEDNRLSPDMVQRKVKAALNKMTPEKFDKISGQILDIASQSKFETDGRTLRQVIQLTFEKATDEAAWSSMYAKFCKVMMESMDPNIKDENIKDVRTGKVVTGGILFRKYLLNRCQEEFQRGWKVNLPPKPEGETDEAAMLSDEYYIAAAAKRRGLGLIQFIGELFKLGMLTERIMQECVKKLVDYEGVPEEAEVESLCKLLRTIGAVLDGSEKSRSSMDAYFDRIQTMINHPEIQSRLKFMLMDIVDLRKKNWEVKEVDKGPKTLAEIQADVAKAAAEKEAASRANAQRGGRPAGGRNDGRSYSQGGNYGQSDYQRQMAQNTINPEELRRLKQRNDRNQNAGQTFGPPTMFGPGARGSNPKRGGMGPPSFNRGDDSGPTSRTATPPAGATTSRNSFGVLGDMGSQANDGDANDSISPAPSAASSPPLAKATPVMRSLSGME